MHHPILVDHQDGDEPLSNTSKNAHFEHILQQRLNRRELLQGALATAMLGFINPATQAMASKPNQNLIEFNAVPVSDTDQISLPDGYQAQVIIPFNSPLPHPTQANLKIGSHHDGMHFFAINGQSDDGLLVINHEYIEPRFMHPHYQGHALSSSAVMLNPRGLRPKAEIELEMAAHGVSIVHLRKDKTGQWQTINDNLNRRIDPNTPMKISGPVRGDDLVKTLYSPKGHNCRGTLNNCAHGLTPWGSYLTCEENWAGYFINGAEQPREHSRYGVRKTGHSRYAWELCDTHEDGRYRRFNAAPTEDRAEADYRNEPNTYGWVVEIDPFNPNSTPIKRTALGRFAHEGVAFQPAQAGQPIVCYMGDDSRFEYIYKYVSRDPYQPGKSGGELLDHGTLYVARFHDDGQGEWLPLVYGQNLLTPLHGFQSQADVLVNTRLAADKVGATKMDRPEWISVHPQTGEVYCTLTNNTRRTELQKDAANPRDNNRWGHIIRWREHKNQPTRFSWDIFILAGPPEDSKFADQSLNHTNHFSSPDGLWFDPDGRLWIQTDMSESVLNQDEHRTFGNNQMLACDPITQTLKRFLVGPVGQEITGVCATPDGQTLFVNIQHPGATTSAQDFADGHYTSHWPTGKGTPRSATVAISKINGGKIGT